MVQQSDQQTWGTDAIGRPTANRSINGPIKDGNLFPNLTARFNQTFQIQKFAHRGTIFNQILTAGRGAPTTPRASRRRVLGLVTATAAALAGLAPRRPRATAATQSHPDLPPFVLHREAWAAQPPGAGMRLHAIERITIHHTGPPAWYGAPAAPAYLRAIQAFHTGPERRWPDIAYHLLIDLDGAVWQGRPLAFAGDTATAYDPTGHALIALLGDYDLQTPNPAQLDALSAATHWLLDTFSLTLTTIATHRDYAPTACPGRNLYALIRQT